MGFKETIYKLFSRDKGNQVAAQGRGKALDDSRFSGAMAFGSGVQSVFPSSASDVGLLSRYADYEDMDDYPELSAALNIFADDATIPDSVRGKSIWAESKDRVIRDIVDDLLHRRLRLEEDIWASTRCLAKYGNNFGEIVVNDSGVVGINYLPVPTMRRLVNEKGILIGFVQDLSGQFNLEQSDFASLPALKEKLEKKGIIYFEPWEIVHWRLQSKYLNSLYGFSVLDAARWIWKRLAMFEDTALIYMLTRSPGRYVFRVNTGDLPPEESMAMLKKTKRQYKKRTLVNPTTGQLEFRANPLSPEDDIWLATRGDGTDSSGVDVLSGPEWNHMDQMEYFRDKLLTAIGIPKSYFGGEAEADQGLAQKDVRFARTCMRLQREFKNGTRQIVRVHLAALNIDPDVVKWDTRMTVPSSIFELQQIEVMNAQAGLIETLSEYFSKEWLLQHVLHLSQDEAINIVNDKSSEDERVVGDQARIAAMIQKKYPGVDVGGPESGAPTEDVDVSKKIDKLTEKVKETMQTSSRVIKRIGEVEPRINRTIRRMAK